jgi:hypothetical protein
MKVSSEELKNTMPDLFINDYINNITSWEKRIGAYVGYKPPEPFWVPGKGFMYPVKRNRGNRLDLNEGTILCLLDKRRSM